MKNKLPENEDIEPLYRMGDYEIITFDHLDLRSLSWPGERELFKNFIFKRLEEYEKSSKFISSIDDKMEYARLFCVIENQRNERNNCLSGFDFERWIDEYFENKPEECECW